jgi:hypothetical protein
MYVKTTKETVFSATITALVIFVVKAISLA